MVPESCVLVQHSWWLHLKVWLRSVLNCGTLWRLYRVQHCAARLRRHASQTGIMRNVPTLMQNDMVRMMLWVTTHKVTVCVTMTLKMAVLSSFLIGTTASEVCHCVKAMTWCACNGTSCSTLYYGKLACTWLEDWSSCKVLYHNTMMQKEARGR